MNVVLVDGDVSYPPTSGKRLRTLNLMLPLAKRHRITYLARGAHGAEAREATEFLRGHGIETVIVHHPVPRKRGAGLYLRLAGNLLSPLPYSVSSHVSEPMRKAAEELAARRRVDLWGDRNRSLEMGLVGRRRVEQGFDIRRMVARYEALYR